jgi:hypothetical protein
VAGSQYLRHYTDETNFIITVVQVKAFTIGDSLYNRFYCAVSQSAISLNIIINFEIFCSDTRTNACFVQLPSSVDIILQIYVRAP